MTAPSFLQGLKCRLIARISSKEDTSLYRVYSHLFQCEAALKITKDPCPETDILGKFKHPGLVEFLKSGTCEDRSYLLTRWVEVKTLEEVSRYADSETFRVILWKIADTLDFLHEKGWIHGDLHPGNLLVKQDGDPIIIDLGLARRKTDKPPSVFRGTPRYSPPTHLGHITDVQRDIFAFGTMAKEVGNSSRFLTSIIRRSLNPDSKEAFNSFKAIKRELERGIRRKKMTRWVRLPRPAAGGPRNDIKLAVPLSAKQLMLSGKLTEALNILEKHLPEQMTASAEITYLNVLFRSGKFQDLIKKARKILSDRKRNKVEIETLLAQSLARCGRIDEGIKLLEGSKSKSHLLPETLGILYLNKGELDKAEEFFRKIDPTDTQTRISTLNHLGLIQQGRKKFEEAEKFFKEAISCTERRGDRLQLANFRLNLAALYHLCGKWRNAYIAYREIDEVLLPTDDSIIRRRSWFNRSLFLIEMGELYEAEKLLAKWEIKNRLLDPYIDLIWGEVLFEKGCYRDARSRYLSFLRGSKEDQLRILAKKQLCRTYISEGREIPVLIQQSSLVSLPKDEYLVRLEESIFVKERPFDADKIAKILDQAETIAPAPASQWELLFNLGLHHYLNNDWKAAEDYFHKARAILDDHRKNCPEEFMHATLMTPRRRKYMQVLEKLSKTPTNQGHPPPGPLPSREGGMGLSGIELLVLFRRLLSSDKPKDLLCEILDWSVDFTRAKRGFLILTDEKETRPLATRHLDEEKWEETFLPISNSILKKVAKTGSSILTSNAREDSRFQDSISIREYNLLSILAIPLWSKGKIIGMIYLDAPQDENHFHSVDVTELTGIADLATTIYDLKNSKENLTASQCELSEQIEKQNRELQIAIRQRSTRQMGFEKMVGASRPMQQLYDLLNVIAKSPASLFIVGESGTGKELVARAIQNRSGCASKPFVAINCAAIPHQLLERELFGAKRGAYTDARHDQIGLFEAAGDGIIFLDEIGDLPLEMQPKLLRTLEEKEFRPIGATRAIPIRARIITATNWNLESEIQKGKFRQDLYYRLCELKITLPPLRDRLEDLPMLADFFLNQMAKEEKLEKAKLDPAALELLCQHNWPGNVRELKSVLRQAIFFARGGTIDRGVIAKTSSFSSKAGKTAMPGHPLEFREIERLLHEYQGNRSRVAENLGISRRTLYLKMKKMSIPLKNARALS